MAEELSISAVSNSVGAIVVANFRAHPVRNTLFCGWYLLALAAALAFTGFSVSMEALDQWEVEMVDLKPQKLAMNSAQGRLRVAESSYYASKGWFGSCPQPVCSEAYAHYQRVQQEFDAEKSAYVAGLKHANANLGVWSPQAVEEARGAFWRNAQGGADFAKRTSYWDLWYSVIFRGISAARGNDESMLSWVVELVFRVLTNIAMAVVGVVLSFAWGVSETISLYAPSWPEAILAWIIAVSAATAISCTALIGCCGLTGAGLAIPVVAAYNANRQQRRLHRGND